METFVEQLREIVSPILDREGCELVELQVKGKKGSRMIRVYVDTAGGVSLDQCESISRQFSEELDISDVVDGRYRLEVSSPGLTRPLKAPQDFGRHLNKRVRILYESEEVKASFEGEIVSVSDETVRIAGKKEVKDIPFVNIRQGKLTLPW